MPLAEMHSHQRLNMELAVKPSSLGAHLESRSTPKADGGDDADGYGWDCLWLDMGGEG